MKNDGMDEANYLKWFIFIKKHNVLKCWIDKDFYTVCYFNVNKPNIFVLFLMNITYTIIIIIGKCIKFYF